MPRTVPERADTGSPIATEPIHTRGRPFIWAADPGTITPSEGDSFTSNAAGPGNDHERPRVQRGGRIELGRRLRLRLHRYEARRRQQSPLLGLRRWRSERLERQPRRRKRGPSAVRRELPQGGVLLGSVQYRCARGRLRQVFREADERMGGRLQRVRHASSRPHGAVRGRLSEDRPDHAGLEPVHHRVFVSRDPELHEDESSARRIRPVERSTRFTSSFIRA